MKNNLAILPEPDSEQQLITDWLRGKSDKTQGMYLVHIRDFQQFTGKPILRTTYKDMVAFKEHCVWHKPNTIIAKLDAVCGVLKFAQAEGLIKRSPGVEFRRQGMPSRVPTFQDKVLTENQVQKILETETNPVRRTLFLTLYYTGMRISEALPMDISLCKPVENDMFEFPVVRKGGYTDFIRIPGWLFAKLKDVTKVGVKPFPVSRQTAWAWARKAGERVGVEKVTPHSFRHSSGTHALYNGAKIHEVARHLGHRGLGTVMEYAHRIGDGPGAKLNITDSMKGVNDE